MKINPQFNTGAVGGPVSKASASAKTGAHVETAKFDTTRSVSRALEQVPDVRPDKVEQAKNLLSDPHYPPLEIIEKISVLLAIHSGGK